MITRMNVWEQQVGRTAATFPAIGRSNGYLQTILSKTDTSWDGRLGAFQEIPVATGVDSSAWVSGVLLAKLHAKNAWANTSTKLIVQVKNIMLVPEEPDVVYVSSATPVASVEFVQGTDNAPALKLAQFTGPIGPMLQVILRWEQGSTAAGAAQTASVSVDLVGRPA
ncbi:MAG: hypothetical protein JNL21_07260 [Myxococcales bacterium]|nr:hypothetical protein [Myxococcales bacterium]